MSKEASPKLFLLIKSLTKSEKRYFRQYAERHTIGEKNNYLCLFDAILKLEEYDEAVLKEQLKNTSYVSYFAVAKRYLYEQILESLHLFHQNHSIHEKIKKQLHYCKILSIKGLVNQAEKALDKAQGWIESYQLVSYKPILIEARRNLMKNSRGIGEVQDSFEELEVALEQLKKTNWYWKQGHQIFALHYQKVNVQNPEQEAIFAKIVSDLQKAGEPELLQSRLNYFRVLATAAFMKGEREEAYNCNKQALDLCDAHPFLIELEPQLYIGNFNNFLIDNFTLGRYDVVEQGIDKLRQLPQQKIFKPFAKLESRIFELTYSLQLNARITQKKFKEALLLLPALTAGLKKYKKAISLNYQLQFNYLMAYILFVNQEWEEVLTCLDFIRNPQVKNVMEELIMAADRLYYLTHFELQNYLYLESVEAAIKRSRKKKLSLSALEKNLFKYLGKIANPVLSRKKKQDLWVELKHVLDTIQQEPSEKRAWIYFDYHQWIENKTQF